MPPLLIVMSAKVDPVPPEPTTSLPLLPLALTKIGPVNVRVSVIVTVVLPAIQTVSLSAGTVPPGHGALAVVEFQLPVPVLVIVAALVARHNKRHKQLTTARVCFVFIRSGCEAVDFLGPANRRRVPRLAFRCLGTCADRRNSIQPRPCRVVT